LESLADLLRSLSYEKLTPIGHERFPDTTSLLVPIGGSGRQGVQGANTALMKAMADRESERRAIEQTLCGSNSGSVQAALADVREFSINQLQQIRGALNAQPDAARFELSKHIDRGIVMRPTTRRNVQFYTAEGEWNLVGKNEGRSPVTPLRNLEMVARDRNVLKIPHKTRFLVIGE